MKFLVPLIFVATVVASAIPQETTKLQSRQTTPEQFYASVDLSVDHLFIDMHDVSMNISDLNLAWGSNLDPINVLLKKHMQQVFDLADTLDKIKVFTKKVIDESSAA